MFQQEEDFSTAKNLEGEDSHSAIARVSRLYEDAVKSSTVLVILCASHFLVISSKPFCCILRL